MNAEALISAGDGSVEQAVRAVMAWVRSNWRILFGGKSVDPPEAALAEELSQVGFDGPSLDRIFALFEHLLIDLQQGSLPASSFQALTFLDDLGGFEDSRAEIIHFAMRDIRVRYKLQPTECLSRCVRSCTETLSALADGSGGKVPLGGSSLAFVSLVQGIVEAEFCDERVSTHPSPNFFIELCATLGVIAPAGPEHIQIATSRLSPTSLLGYLFGFPTSIEGFDVLFGGPGLMFTEDLALLLEKQRPGSSADLPQNGVSGRTVLVAGPFGSGKTLLSLQIAVEVARKGGIACIIAAEQSPSECLFALESIGIRVKQDSFRVARGLHEAVRAMHEPEPHKGLIAFLSESGLTYVAALAAVREQLGWLGKYPLRVLFIDPINALAREKGDALRQPTAELFVDAKEKNVNIWMTCERSRSVGRDDTFEENIADTVIAMGAEQHEQYPRRYVEVLKSRLQKELPGRHPLAIRSSRGIRIYPYPAVLPGWPRHQRRAVGSETASLGIDTLDAVVGTVLNGDLILFHGPTGSSKTVAGAAFAFGGKTDGVSLVVSDYDEDRLSKWTELACTAQDRRSLDSIEFLSIPAGFTEPGRILDDIQCRLSDHARCNRPIDRMVVGNLSRWVSTMPLIAADTNFASALADLARMYGATCLMVIGDARDPLNTHARNLLLDKADCVVAFDRIDLRGQRRHVVRVEKTRTMDHRREMFELVTDARGVRVEPNLSLWRLDPDGRAHPVPISIFLHWETKNQREHTRELLGALRTTVSPHVRIRPQTMHFDAGLMPLGSSSSVDELQVLQLDEFQIPHGEGTSFAPPQLVEFSAAANAELVEGRLPKLCEHVRRRGVFVAVPYYMNVGFLAYRRSAFLSGVQSFPRDWESLCDISRRWDSAQLFFACHASADNRFESYNCLFLEMLMSFPEIVHSGPEHCRLEAWCKHKRTLQIAEWFYHLCHRSHAYTMHQLRTLGPKAPDIDYGGAVVWRHWYTTLNQMLSGMDPHERRDIQVRPLFHQTISGEWYLAVPAYSAASNIGRDIIRVLTSPERELRRMHRGVGMPTRTSFYERPAAESRTPIRISPFFDLPADTDIYSILDGAFRRSAVPCYRIFAETLSAHLLRILSLDPEEDLKAAIALIIGSLVEEIQLLQNQVWCQTCRGAADSSPQSSLTRNLHWAVPHASGSDRSS
jgi:KaiC/GvpD/RAD55 family RecA-like ATPase